MAVEITMHLLDNTTSGRVAFFLDDWDGYACRVPRDYVKSCSKMIDIRERGVILLFGWGAWSGMPLAYVCSAGDTTDRPGIIDMLGEFARKSNRKYKDWGNAVIFSEPAGTLAVEDLRYLKRRIYDIIRKAGRASIQNDRPPRKLKVSPRREAELEELLKKYIMAAEMLGFFVFGEEEDRKPEAPEPKEPEAKAADTAEASLPREEAPAAASPAPASPEKPVLFHMYRKVRGMGIVGATLKRTENGYLLAAGSDISRRTASSASSLVCELRAKANVINDTLAEDLPVPTPSSGASVVLGYNISAWDMWLTTDGRTIEEVYPGEMRRMRGRNH